MRLQLTIRLCELIFPWAVFNDGLTSRLVAQLRAAEQHGTARVAVLHPSYYFCDFISPSTDLTVVT